MSIPHPFSELRIQKPELLKLGQDLGETRIEGILKDFYERASKDLLIGFFFDGKDLIHIAAKQKEFLMRAMGLSPSYTGKSPADAHASIAKILSGHFDRRLVILENTLKDAGLNSQQIEVWIAFENAFRDQIVVKE